MIRRARVVSSLAFALMLAGCAFMNRENTPLLNVVERRLVPATTGIKVLVSPIVVPVGIAAGATDVFVVHPLMVIPPAARDVRNFWRQRIDGYVTRMGAVIPRAAVTPVLFAGSWLGRSAFDVGPARRRAEGRESGSALETAIARDDPGAISRQLTAAARTRTVLPSPLLRSVVERYGDNAPLQRQAFDALLARGDEPDETYLLDLLRSGAGAREAPLIEAFVLRRSRRGGEVMLELLFSPATSPDRARTLLIGIVRIADDDQLRRLAERIRR